MSSSPKQPYQSQINALSGRFDHQDERFDQIKSTLDHLIQAFDKSPVQDLPEVSLRIAADFPVGGSDRCKWLMHKSGQQRRNLNNCFILTVVIESRKVVVDMVRGTSYRS